MSPNLYDKAWRWFEDRELECLPLFGLAFAYFGVMFLAAYLR